MSTITEVVYRFEAVADRYRAISEVQADTIRHLRHALEVAKAGPRKRPNRATVGLLLSMSGDQVDVITHDLIEDEDGVPVEVAQVHQASSLHVTLEQLSWTQAELDNPLITD